MKNWCIAIILIVFGVFVSPLAAQTANKPLTLTLNDIVFDNASERAEFEKLVQHQTPDYFKLLFYSGGEYNTQKIAAARQKVAAFGKQLTDKRFDKKSPQKKVKKVFENTHETFFKKYEYSNHFKDVFDKGTFNCVSGTAIFALLFDSLNIPYVVKEQPTHVYLMAYNTTENIEVEATLPTQGYTTYSLDFKKKYAQKLRDNKIVSDEEYNTIGYEGIFDAYYLRDSSINFRQLVGLQYHNEAIYSLEDKEYEKAIQQAAKAYLLYPAEFSEYGLRSALGNFFLNASHTQKSELKYLELISRFSGEKEEEKNEGIVVYVLSEIWEKNFESKTNPAYFDTSCNFVQQNINDSATTTEALFYCSFQKGRYYLQNSLYASALPLLKEAYTIKPDEDLRKMYYGALVLSLKKLEAKDILTALDSSIGSDSSYFTSPTLTAAYLDMVAQVGSEEFIYGSPKKGLEMVEHFEQLYGTTPNYEVNDENIVRLYGDACIYFFRKGQRQKAKEYLQRGLKFVPNNRELKHRLNSLN